MCLPGSDQGGNFAAAWLMMIIFPEISSVRADPIRPRPRPLLVVPLPHPPLHLFAPVYFDPRCLGFILLMVFLEVFFGSFHLLSLISPLKCFDLTKHGVNFAALGSERLSRWAAKRAAQLAPRQRNGVGSRPLGVNKTQRLRHPGALTVFFFLNYSSENLCSPNTLDL